MSIQVNMEVAETTFFVPMKSSTNIAPLPPPPPYEGAYTVTPSSETQTLSTAGMKMTGNVTVNPIPSNYGLITWDGSTITVS